MREILMHPKSQHSGYYLLVILAQNLLMNNLLLKADTVCPHCRAGQVGRSSRCPPKKEKLDKALRMAPF